MFDSLKWKVQKWFALRRAKRLEAEQLPTKAELASEHKEFANEAKELSVYLEPSSESKARVRGSKKSQRRPSLRKKRL